MRFAQLTRRARAARSFSATCRADRGCSPGR
jgi:hypothetical protein